MINLVIILFGLFLVSWLVAGVWAENIGHIIRAHRISGLPYTSLLKVEISQLLKKHSNN